MNRIRCLPQLARTARVALRLVCWFCLGAVRGTGADAVPDLNTAEFQAVFLSKFLPYVSWPNDTLPAQNQPITVGLFGYDPFGGLLQKLVENQETNGRKITVKILAETNRLEIEKCQVLFVPADKMEAWLRLKSQMDDRGLLTVGADETGAFLKRGGVFSLLTQERKLEINRRNAEKAGLKISAKLLKISKVN